MIVLDKVKKEKKDSCAMMGLCGIPSQTLKSVNIMLESISSDLRYMIKDQTSFKGSFKEIMSVVKDTHS